MSDAKTRAHTHLHCWKPPSMNTMLELFQPPCGKRGGMQAVEERVGGRHEGLVGAVSAVLWHKGVDAG